ncbi:MAG: phosphoribosylamine--glycine ligase [bacterium]|nr:phosphoribosylamine--glycine ligase [bacterium]
MRILIIGSGGREHALAEAYSKSTEVKKVFVVPGNDLMNYTNKKVEIFPNIKSTDYEGILSLAKKLKVNLIDVAQDDPLALGFVDKLEKEGFLVFGPKQKSAEIEWNKDWARNFMQKYNFPNPIFKSFNNEQKAIDYINSLPEQVLYVKASGLAAGKGAIRTNNKKGAIEAVKSMKQFGKSGEIFLIEHCLTGEEFSLFAICDGKNYKIVKAAQDHKTVFEKDQGPNTGGMGCVAQPKIVDKKILKEVEEKIIRPFLLGMTKEQRDYCGILYIGGIVTNPPVFDLLESELPRSRRPEGLRPEWAGGDIKIIEFNARWGDPEAEVIIPSIKTDYLKIALAVIKKELDIVKINFDNKIRISIAGCSSGYPDDYSSAKGKEIFGLLDAMKLKDIKIFGAGVKRQGKRFFANGGRIFHLVAGGKDIREARQKAYNAMSLIYIEGNNLHYRTDIGWRDMERQVNGNKN